MKHQGIGNKKRTEFMKWVKKTVQRKYWDEAASLPATAKELRALIALTGCTVTVESGIYRAPIPNTQCIVMVTRNYEHFVGKWAALAALYIRIVEQLDTLEK